MASPKPSTSSSGKADQNQEGAAGPAAPGSSSTAGGSHGSFQAQGAAEPAKAEPLFGYYENGQYMHICPYDKTHRVRSSRWSQHILKCRHNHELAQRQIGEEVIKLSCKYNYQHRVPANELLLHESSCVDKEKELMGLHFLSLFHRLQTASRATDEESTQEESGHSKPNHDEQGAAGGPSISKLSEQLLALYNDRPNANFHTEVAKVYEAAEKAEQKYNLERKLGMQNPEPEEESYGMRRRPRRVHVRKLLVQVYPYKQKFPENPGEDETHDEKWWTEGSSSKKPFYLRDFVNNLPDSYPPGLTWAERRKFDQKNTTRMALERGIGQVYVPPELRPKPKPEDIIDLTRFMKKKDDDKLNKKEDDTLKKKDEDKLN